MREQLYSVDCDVEEAVFDRQGRRLGDLAAEEGPVESGSGSGRVCGLGVPGARFRISLGTEPLPVAQPSAGGDL